MYSVHFHMPKTPFLRSYLWKVRERVQERGSDTEVGSADQSERSARNFVKSLRASPSLSLSAELRSSVASCLARPRSLSVEMQRVYLLVAAALVATLVMAESACAAPPFPCTYTAVSSLKVGPRSHRFNVHYWLTLTHIVQYDLTNMWRNSSAGATDFTGTSAIDGSTFYVYVRASWLT